MSCVKRTLSLAVLLLIVACTGLIPALAPAAGCGQQGGEKRNVMEMVRLTAEVIGRQQCNEPVGEDVVEEWLRLQLRFRITNISTEPVIIYRYGPVLFNARVSRTLAQLPIAKFGFEERPKSFQVPPRDFEARSPANEFRLAT